MAEKEKKDKAKKKIKRTVYKGVVHVNATFNNTIITITDEKGEVLCWGSGGTAGFKGTRKSMPFAAQKATDQVATKAKRLGLKEVEIKIKGIGPGREAAIRQIQASGFLIRTIEDLTPIPHNGCRAPKKRSV